jgi:hypothetical protein
MEVEKGWGIECGGYDMACGRVGLCAFSMCDRVQCSCMASLWVFCFRMGDGAKTWARSYASAGCT